MAQCWGSQSCSGLVTKYVAGIYYSAADAAKISILNRGPVDRMLSSLHCNGLDGQTITAWGAGQFSMPHMITVDKEGAVYVADVGRHQVLTWFALCCLAPGLTGAQILTQWEAAPCFGPGNEAWTLQQSSLQAHP
eukprot:scaffold21041_cov24-Tisochrysis_lutea.AAC.2